MMHKSFSLIFLMMLGFSSFCQEVHLHINRGEFIASDDALLPYVTFNYTSEFEMQTAILEFSMNEEIALKVFNNDSIAHGFSIDGVIAPEVIDSGDSAMFALNFQELSCYEFYDHLNYPDHRFLGLAGMIAVKSQNTGNFFWNIKEHDKIWSETINEGGSVNWDEYYPDYFTINGNSNPDINNDPKARVVGQVNDDLFIFMTNSGVSAHSMHFHGYHCEVVFHSSDSQWVGRSKDTVPIRKGENIVLKLTPHQPGEFPVHDHNLVAVSGGGVYPNGMFTTILIEP